MMFARLLAASLVLSLFGGLASSAEPDAKNDRMQMVLRRYPEADTDKDGKLSKEEARAFLAKMKSAKSAPADKDSPSDNKPTDGKSSDGTSPASKSSESNSPGKTASAVPSRAKRKARRASDAPTPDHANVSYGSHPNNLLDLWLAKSDRPTPLVVFIHGGGFVGGDKGTITSTAIKQCLDAGVSIASINYRFRTEAAINVVLRDTARAIQFLRYKSADYNLDKTRVAAFGGSAGAGASLWLAFHDDLADPQNDDPVLRESSRLLAAGSSAGQASYDILRWAEVLGSEEALRFYPQSTWPAFYGLETVDDLQSEKGKKLRADADMLGMITADDPPVCLGAGSGHDALANKGD
ncbi:MAG TPA: alpha/beta hydrolase fold domain-containing protein, partial [Pirellulales bacterium]|nr:alpha/beta hydrolase fold domain-containing protein [Pirellulales bacterium]